MDGWFYGVLVAAVGGGTVCSLLPDGGKGAAGRSLRFISSLCVLLMMLIPLSGFLNDIKDKADSLQNADGSVRQPQSDGTPYENGSADWLLSESGKGLSSELAEYIESRYKIGNSQNIRIVLSLNTDDISAVRITHITVDLRGCRVTESVREMETELKNMLQTEVSVLVR